MRNILLTLAFDGSNYCGYQVQKNGLSIAECVQDAIMRITGVRSDIKGCSRTDAGVHANMFCISFFSDSPLPCEELRKALDAVLPPDIAALSCREVPSGFHARYSCAGKRYRYLIWNSPSKHPFMGARTLHVRRELDVSLLDWAAGFFCGTHDFTSFMAAGSSVKDAIRTVTDCRVTRDGPLVEIAVSADGFLYHMVRIIAGTLLAVAEGKYPPEQIPEIIAAKDRGASGPTAPAHALYLDEVFYPEEVLSPERSAHGTDR